MTIDLKHSVIGILELANANPQHTKGRRSLPHSIEVLSTQWLMGNGVFCVFQEEEEESSRIEPVGQADSCLEHAPVRSIE